MVENCLINMSEPEVERGYEMRVIAMYLPQFHRVKENDKWWGEGFTDWVTVKKAKPLYEGHRQPHIPLDDNYYDLLDKHTLVWQAELMKKYSIDGLCMYHYWFKDGKKILEKPAEKLLQWTDIEMPFCFCWANETWARTWSNIKGKNVWASTFEKNSCEDANGILLEEKYGDKRQWNEHFDYLLPFFKDRRYITIKGKPVFIIYRSLDIPCIREMIGLWRNRAVKNGLKGLYIIGIGDRGRNKNVLDAELYHEPRASFSMWEQNHQGITKFNYKNIWKQILERKGDAQTFFGGFVSYDDTPRRGIEGKLVEGGTPKEFSYYLEELMAKNEANGNHVVFLNAWNEWGEGMYLEPDVLYQYSFLEAVLNAKKNYHKKVLKYKKYTDDREFHGMEINNIINQRNKFEHYLNLLDVWMVLKENGLGMEEWFLKKNYKDIALYGYGTLGRHFVKELENSNIRIRYIVDHQKHRIFANFPVYLPEDDLPEADIIVVSATYYFDEIYQKLCGKGMCNVVSLEQIIGEI